MIEAMHVEQARALIAKARALSPAESLASRRRRSLSSAMFQRLLRAAAPLLSLFSPPPLAAQPPAPVTAGRPAAPYRASSPATTSRAARPGTEGERRTIAYIAEQFRARGLEPAGENGELVPAGRASSSARPGAAPVALDRRRPRRSRSTPAT